MASLLPMVDWHHSRLFVETLPASLLVRPPGYCETQLRNTGFLDLTHRQIPS